MQPALPNTAGLWAGQVERRQPAEATSHDRRGRGAGQRAEPPVDHRHDRIDQEALVALDAAAAVARVAARRVLRDPVGGAVDPDDDHLVHPAGRDRGVDGLVDPPLDAERAEVWASNSSGHRACTAPGSA